MSFELPKLPYALDALEPFMSKQTLEFHYGKHHQAYVNNLNNLIPGTEFETATLDEIVKKSSGGIFNNGAQVWNHTFFFFQFDKNGSKEPEGALKLAIEKQFGSLQQFKDEFGKAAVTLFGSGWAWLVADSNNNLKIVQTSNAGNPLTEGLKPLMTCDVWEHAYYLDKQNLRPKYVEDFWNILDWDFVAERFEK